MECPACRHDIPAIWKPLYAATGPTGEPLTKPSEKIQGYRERQGTKQRFTEGISIEVEWMQCPNEKCNDFLVHIDRVRFNASAGMSVGYDHAKYIALPRNVARTADPLVPDPLALAYRQAALILGDSPGMSAVLSRRILSDILSKYAGCAQRNLEAQIDSFIADSQHPDHVKENLHHLRELANMAAHTKEDLSTGEVLDTSPEEAEWALEVVDSLFEHFIIGPERSRERRAAIDAKIAKAGRKPLGSA